MPDVLLSVREALVRAMASRHIDLRARANDVSPPVASPSEDLHDAPGVFVCTGCDESTVKAIQRHSAASLHPLLAIVVTDDLVRHSLTWPLLQHGAEDVFLWNRAAVAGGTRGEVLDAIAARLRRWGEIDAILDSPLVATHLVGRSRAWRCALRQVVEAARFTQDDILLHGDSGTGKELATRLIHTLDLRSHRRELIIVDCTTLLPELIGSELFGHERGAFTGAANPRDGAFTLAHQGTLFLDEIGELPVTLQAQLLRVVQERSCKRVGGNRWLPSEFRLICATHRDLQADVQAGRFRNDLYWRIAAQVITLPSLNERRDDVLPLARHFMAKALPEGTDIDFSPAVQTLLLQHDWPGNVRQLRQLVLRMCGRHVGPGPLTVGDLPPEERPRLQDMPPSPPPDPTGLLDGSDDTGFEQCIRQDLARGRSLKDLSRRTQDAAIRLAVEEAGGNLQRAAQRLGVSDRTVQLWRAQASRSAAG